MLLIIEKNLGIWETIIFNKVQVSKNDLAFTRNLFTPSIQKIKERKLIPEETGIGM